MKELLFILAQVAFVFGAVTLQNKPQASCSTTKLQDVITNGLGLVFRKNSQINTDSVFIDREELKFLLDNMTVYGLENSIIDGVSVDSDAMIVNIAFHTNFPVKSKYWCYGFLLSKPFYGAGDFSVELVNTLVEMTIPYSITKDKRGKQVMNLESFNYTYDVRDNETYNLTNLYYGDEVKSEKMHRLMQENWKVLTVQFGGYMLDPTASEIFTSLRELMHSLFNINWKYVTAQYGRAVASKLIDIMAKAYKSYFQLVPLKSFVEY